MVIKIRAYYRRHQLKCENTMSLAYRIAVFFRPPRYGRYPEVIRKSRAVRVIQWLLTYLVMSSVMHPFPAIASTADLDNVLAGTHQRIEALDLENFESVSGHAPQCPPRGAARVMRRVTAW